MLPPPFLSCRGEFVEPALGERARGESAAGCLIARYVGQTSGAKRTRRNRRRQDGVLKNLREDRKAARAAGQYGPAVRADELLGKYLAMFTDVSKNVGVPDISAEDAITDLCTPCTESP